MVDPAMTPKRAREDSGMQYGARFWPLLLACAAMVVALLYIATHSELHSSSLWKSVGKVFWKNASVRPPLLLILIIAGWGWVVRVCRSAALNLELVLGGALQPPSATYQSALVLLATLLFARLVHFAASETPGLTWRPWLSCNIMLHLAFIALGLWPSIQMFSGHSRYSLVRTLWESLIAPLGPVTFWHVIVADYLTSVAKAFSDLQLSMCISTHIFFPSFAGPTAASTIGYVRSTELWETYHDHCADSYANAVMLALPFWWRLMQCLKVYSQTREQKNLWNALKYSTAFPLVYAGYLRRHSPSPHHDHLFIAAAILQSGFTFTWDVLMDWGLPMRDPHSWSGWAFRQPLLITRSKSVYIMLCVCNFLLRFVWTLSIFGGIAGRGLGMFFFEVVELLRRTVWAVFRIEWEVVCKVYNSSYGPHITATSLKQIGCGDSEASDEMMPLEGGKDPED